MSSGRILRTLVITFDPTDSIRGVESLAVDYARELVERSGFDAIG